jgi:CRP/FNR family transcriptional regulator, cyclic AMP receptor protein
MGQKMSIDSFPVLVDTGWLSRTPREFRLALLKLASARTVPAGSYLYYSDDMPGGFWGLESGSVGIEYALSERLIRTAFVLHPGHWLGEASLLDGRRRRVGVRALVDCTFLGIPANHMERLLAERPENWRAIGQLAIEHYDFASGIAADGMIPDTRQRILAVLMRLSGLRDAKPPASPTVHLSKEEIGNIANVSRSALSPILRDLEVRGVVVLGYRSVRILDPVALGQLVRLAAA